MRFIKMKKITGIIELVTGLHIGGSSDTMEIGGIDNPIIRNSHDEQPYIPGSSLKGKMRSLIEWQLSKMTFQKNGDTGPCQCSDCEVCKVFGVSSDKNAKIGPTRLLVSDSFLTKDMKQRGEDYDLTEIKYENSIDRITAKAVPRPLERVIPGVTFSLDISYRVFDMEDSGKIDEDNFDAVVLKALALVEQDCLGGAGSRGCGKIRFLNLRDETGKEIRLPKLAEAVA